ncbi:MAG: SpoIIE family protein phosphatase [Clostridia bacterium]
MEEKRLFRAYEKVKTFISSVQAEKIWLNFGSFIIGMISSQGLAFGKYAPFAVAFVASVPKGGTLFAVIGAIIGYMLPSAIYMPFRYIAAIIAVGAIKWALSELVKINTSLLFAPVLSLLALLTTGMTMVLINSSLPSVAVMYIAEACLAAGTAFFFSRCINIAYKKKFKGVLENADLASIAISIAVVILSFNNVTIYDVSVGRILMIIAILICSGTGGIAGGSISGVAIGAIAGLSSLGLSYLSGAYGLGGLMAGVFSSVGKMYGVLAFIVAHGIASLQIGDTSTVLVGAIEVAFASIIYMFIPKSQAISNIFSFRHESLTGAALKSNMILRLNHASNALSEVSSSVNEISKKLAKSSKINIGQVYNKSASEICAGCSMRAICWKKEKDETIKTFTALTSPLRSKGKVETSDFGEELIERCGRIGDMRESVNKFYRDFLTGQSAEIRAEQVRDIAGEQFEITSAMLKDIAVEFKNYQSFDEESSNRISEVFKTHNIYPMEICCRTDNFGRMTIEIELSKKEFTSLNKTKITREISKACGRNFTLPCVSKTETKCKIQMCQKPLLDVKTAIAQESAGNFCGDSVVGFYDGQGNYIAIVSDGMGTGGMAAVDGTMACTMMESLLKAGISYNTALRLVNSALMSKCQDETLATMDIASLDLFTGKCMFRKAGATGTVIKRGKKVEYVERESLPVGIMQEVNFAFLEENLKNADIVVLLSDGATSCGTDWLIETVENFEGIDPQSLADEIVNYAKRNRTDGHKDDISALVIFVNE